MTRQSNRYLYAWKYRLIMHSGEGPPEERIRKLEFERLTHISEAAAACAEKIDDEEKRRECCSDADFDGITHHLELLDVDGAWKRFHVECHVRRSYHPQEVTP